MHMLLKKNNPVKLNRCLQSAANYRAFLRQCSCKEQPIGLLPVLIHTFRHFLAINALVFFPSLSVDMWIKKNIFLKVRRIQNEANLHQTPPFIFFLIRRISKLIDFCAVYYTQLGPFLIWSNSAAMLFG